MLNMTLRSWLLGSWGAIVIAIAGGSLAMGASVPTIAFLITLGASPAVVMLLIAASAPSPTVAEIIYAVDTKNGRR